MLPGLPVRACQWKAERKKVMRDLADFMHDLYGGVHDTVLDKLLIEDHKDPFSVDWGKGEVTKVCFEIARNLRKGASTISSSVAESAPPPLAARALSGAVAEIATTFVVKK